MKRIFLIASLFALPAFSAMAAIDTNGLIASYQAEGYATIEVTKGLNQTKVEALKEGVKVEVIYDNATGAVLKSENGSVESGDDIAAGVSVREVTRDFVNDDGESSDDAAEDASDDSADDGDNEGSDDSGSDDNGGDDNGSDDGGSDDNGGDDNGSDNEGSGDNGGEDHDSSDHDGGDSEGNDD